MKDCSITVEYRLDSADVAEIRSAHRQFTDVTDRATEPTFYDHHWDVAALLPTRVRRFLDDFRRHEPAAACVISGFPVDDSSVGPTPGHWETADNDTVTEPQDRFLAACGLALGEPYSWATLQNGCMIQNVFPIEGDEQRLSGHGSEAFLVFHTDDAFHPDSCDYLLLLGIRNHAQVPTLISSVRDVALSEDDRRLLSEDRSDRERPGRGLPHLRRCPRARHDRPRALPAEVLDRGCRAPHRGRGARRHRVPDQTHPGHRHPGCGMSPCSTVGTTGLNLRPLDPHPARQAL